MATIDDLKLQKKTIWINPDKEEMDPLFRIGSYSYTYVKAAQNRFMRFMPYFAKAFPETAGKMGVIESGLAFLPDMQEKLSGGKDFGKLLLKDDAHLPIAGSVKARGGFHAVMTIAEHLCYREGMLLPAEDHSRMASDEFREFFSRYTIQVGSTGNLGIAVGRLAAKLGFRTIVHMSRDAKEWKKQLLRSEGVLVKEYDGDYTLALEEGRRLASKEKNSFFIDDENSEDLFFGYSCAALRLKIQLRRAGISVDPDHPLFVWLPCGVGGAPGGITFGLKEIFGEYVHCFFAEPVAAPCFTLAMAEGGQEIPQICEIGLDGKTIADGLAVGRPSGLACRLMKPLLSGCLTVTDEELLEDQKLLHELEDLRIEPSACAGFAGYRALCKEDPVLWSYIREHGLEEKMNNASHIIWATGGGLMPEEED